MLYDTPTEPMITRVQRQEVVISKALPSVKLSMIPTPDINAKVEDLAAVLGRGGYEGIQNDSAGRLWIVEDSGGATPTGSKAKNPNSFVYRFTPYDRTDLTKGGRLQALQVVSRRTGRPITFSSLRPVSSAAPRPHPMMRPSLSQTKKAAVGAG